MTSKYIISSLWDHHGHIYELGEREIYLDLNEIYSAEDLYKIIKIETKNRKKGEWIIGFGLPSSFKDGSTTLLEVLDRVSPFNPLYLGRTDYHSAIVNTLALKKANISVNSLFNGGFFEKKDEKLTGLVVDSLKETVYKSIPIEEEELVAKIKKGMEIIKKNNLSGATDMMITGNTFEAFKKLDIKKEMPVCVLGYFKFEGNVFPEIYEGNKFFLKGIKVFLDGALGSRGAALKKPYSDEEDNCGILLYKSNEILEIINEANKRKLNVAFHAIGDRAIEEVLKALKKFKNRKIEIRIEHLQITSKALIKKLNETDFVPSIQPSHYHSDKEWAIKRVGEKRFIYSYLLKSIVKGKKNFYLGSDFPIEPINPIRNLNSALKRQKSEELSLKQTLKGFSVPSIFKNFSLKIKIKFKTEKGRVIIENIENLDEN